MKIDPHWLWVGPILAGAFVWSVAALVYWAQHPHLSQMQVFLVMIGAGGD